MGRMGEPYQELRDGLRGQQVPLPAFAVLGRVDSWHDGGRSDPVGRLRARQAPRIRSISAMPQRIASRADMKRSTEPTPDVYLSCATRDLAQADEIARQLRSAGFVVQRVSELEWQQAVAADRVETVWTALSHSSALVVLGT